MRITCSVWMGLKRQTETETVLGVTSIIRDVNLALDWISTSGRNYFDVAWATLFLLFMGSAISRSRHLLFRKIVDFFVDVRVLVPRERLIQTPLPKLSHVAILNDSAERASWVDQFWTLKIVKNWNRYSYREMVWRGFGYLADPAVC